jgi:ABC-type uncharacterized transport system auxiliary subunit
MDDATTRQTNTTSHDVPQSTPELLVAAATALQHLQSENLKVTPRNSFVLGHQRWRRRCVMHA